MAVEKPTDPLALGLVDEIIKVEDYATAQALGEQILATEITAGHDYIFVAWVNLGVKLGVDHENDDVSNHLLG